MLIKRSEILASPGFLISLSLLLCNDFVLKPTFSNQFTGKLSDFAGLFAFTVVLDRYTAKPRKDRLCVAGAIFCTLEDELFRAASQSMECARVHAFLANDRHH